MDGLALGMREKLYGRQELMPNWVMNSEGCIGFLSPNVGLAHILDVSRLAQIVRLMYVITLFVIVLWFRKFKSVGRLASTVS